MCLSSQSEQKKKGFSWYEKSLTLDGGSTLSPSSWPRCVNVSLSFSSRCTVLIFKMQAQHLKLSINIQDVRSGFRPAMESLRRRWERSSLILGVFSSFLPFMIYWWHFGWTPARFKGTGRREGRIAEKRKENVEDGEGGWDVKREEECETQEGRKV